MGFTLLLLLLPAVCWPDVCVLPLHASAAELVPRHRLERTALDVPAPGACMWGWGRRGASSRQLRRQQGSNRGSSSAAVLEQPCRAGRRPHACWRSSVPRACDASTLQQACVLELLHLAVSHGLTPALPCARPRLMLRRHAPRSRSRTCRSTAASCRRCLASSTSRHSLASSSCRCARLGAAVRRSALQHAGEAEREAERERRAETDRRTPRQRGG